MPSPRLRTLPALVVLALAGCDPGPASSGEDWTFPAWGQKSDELGSGLTATRDLAVQIFDGYNRVVDTPSGRNCVLPQAGQLELAEFRAGGDIITTEIEYVSTREELEQALDIDATAKIKVGPIGGGGSLGFSRELKTSSRSVAILLRSRHVYTVVNQERHHLTDEAVAMLESDAPRFVRECGTDYVSGVAYGAELAMLVQIEADSLEERQKVEAKLEASGIKAGPASIDASLGAAFENALKNESVEVSVSVDSRGFVPSVDLSVLGKLDADAFGVAAEALAQLRASVLEDECHDQGEFGPGECDGSPARGYLANGARAAVPMGLLRLPFSRTANFPSDQATVNALLEVTREADAATSSLEAFAEVYDTMVSVWAEEVGAMTTSDAPYDFAIYDTSEELRSDFQFAALMDHAQAWAAAYDPENGSEVEALAEIVDDCWSRAEFGDFSECQTWPEDTDAGRAILATLAEYGQARVRPVEYSFVATPHGFYDVPGKCASGFRQPTKAEASRLWLAMERNPEIPECSDTSGHIETGTGAWYDDQGLDCPTGQGAWIERLPSGEFETGCYVDGGILYNDMDLVVLCVPNAGVYGMDVFDLPDVEG
jgi:hypothetical protein